MLFPSTVDYGQLQEGLITLVKEFCVSVKKIFT